MSKTIEIVESVWKSLSEIFRHFLPGILIIGAAYLSHPNCFDSVYLDEGKWLIVMAVIAITVGNTWFVMHRYCVQQVVDYGFCWFKVGGGLCRNGKCDYLEKVAAHVFKYCNAVKQNPELGRHVRFRSLSVVLMYIVSELVIMFAIVPGADNALLPPHGWFALLGLICFAFSVWQNALVRRIEGKIAPSPSKGCRITD